jgi:U3 small nucleolar RNA-associated protein 22
MVIRIADGLAIDGSQFDFSKLNAQVHIIPFISMTSPIPLHRLSPSHSNVRIKSSSAPEDTTSPPTTIHNSHFMQCLTPKLHLVSTYALKQDSPAFSDALALIRIWANQRGYGEGSRLCVHGFKGKGSWWNALLDLLVRGEEPTVTAGPKASMRRALGRGLSSYQMFRAALDVLGAYVTPCTEPRLIRRCCSQVRL